MFSQNRSNRHMPMKAMKILLVVCALTVGITACSSDKKSSSGTSSGSGAAQGAKSLLPSRPACDASKPKYNVGILTVVESPVLSLKDDSVGLKASIEAFNKRGGIGTHCMNLEICDSQGDPNKEVDCARKFAGEGIVATLSDATPFNTQAVKEVMEAAGIPRIGISPGTQELNSND